MIPTRKNKHQNKRLLGRIKRSLKEFVLGNNVKEVVTENEAIDAQIDGFISNFQKSTVD